MASTQSIRRGTWVQDVFIRTSKIYRGSREHVLNNEERADMLAIVKKYVGESYPVEEGVTSYDPNTTCIKIKGVPLGSSEVLLSNIVDELIGTVCGGEFLPDYGTGSKYKFEG